MVTVRLTGVRQTTRPSAPIEGATHGGTGCTECTAVTGVDYSNARKNIYDYVSAWAKARF